MARIAIVEDQVLFLGLLETLIQADPRYEVVLTAETGAAFHRQWHESAADVLLLDLVLPDQDGLEIAQSLLKSPGIAPRILVLSGETSEATVTRVMRSGVHGFVDKLCPMAELLDAIEEVHQGGSYYCKRVWSVYERIRQSGTAVDRVLTRSELRLLPGLALGKSNQEIGVRHRLAPATVQTHRRNIMSKLGIPSNVQLMYYALEQGVITRCPDGTLMAAYWGG
jgi:DNA-binding NarL/FixJ family response regulator